MNVPSEAHHHFGIDWGRLADVAEHLARTEEDAARTFERLARRGGERAEHRLALAAEAEQRMLQLRQWAFELRGHAPE